MSNLDQFITSNPGLQFLAAAVASNSTSIDFDTHITSDFDEYELRMLNVIPASDSANMTARTSSDGGSTYDAGAGDYSFNHFYLNGAATTVVISSGASGIRLATSVGSDTDEEGISGTLHLIRPSETTFTNLWMSGGFNDSLNRASIMISHGYREEAALVDGLRILMSTGNIESGLFALYGVNRA